MEPDEAAILCEDHQGIFDQLLRGLQISLSSSSSDLPVQFIREKDSKGVLETYLSQLVRVHSVEISQHQQHLSKKKKDSVTKFIPQ